jgi:purine-nucleoside phosphorylase
MEYHAIKYICRIRKIAICEEHIMETYRKMKEAFDKYNPTMDMLNVVYGLDSNKKYDAIIVAPSWAPEKVLKNFNPMINMKKKGPYYCGYEVEVENKKFGYIQTSSCAGNMIDCCMMLGNSACSTIFFIGAAGALSEKLNLGDIVTPSYSIAGDGGSLYLYDSISEKNYRKKILQHELYKNRLFEVAKMNGIAVQEKITYCTDSIFCEYFHLDEIKSLGSELIEMETASFMRCMELIEKRYNVLLCVSDNSSCGNALVGRNEEDTKKFHISREVNIPKLILALS